MPALSVLRHFSHAVILVCLLCVSVPAAEMPSSEPVLTKVVILSRHGVRSPTQAGHTLAEWSVRKWPEWPVPRGHLTTRGAWLVTMQWARLGQWFREKALLSGTCPKAEDIRVYADVDQRTRATAKALLDGLAPECSLTYTYADGAQDPVFHPLKAGVCRLDEQTVLRDVLLDSGGPEGLQHALKSGLSLISEVAGPALPKLCADHGLKVPCNAVDIPSQVVVSPERDKAGIEGGLGIAGSLAEIWLLEYAQWPDTLPAWGLGGPGLLKTVLPVHMQVFNAINRAESVAKSQGSMLVSRILDALEDKGDKDAAAARIVAFVGHDTNIANIGGMLGLTWEQPGYVPDQTPPGGALMFTLWKMPDNSQGLGIQYVSLSLNGLRAKTPAQAQQEILVSPVTWAYCSVGNHTWPANGNARPGVTPSDPFMPQLHSPEVFLQTARRALETQCLDSTSEGTLLIGK